MFSPFPLVALPQVKLTGIVGLDNPIGVAILHIVFALSFNTLLFTAFLRSIPISLEESMRVDGASTWQVFVRLIFPLLAPMSATDRKSTRLNSSHVAISYAVFCLKKKK